MSNPKELPAYDKALLLLEEDPSASGPLVNKIRKYRENFPLFCEECLKIRTKEGKLVPFVLRKPQLELWKREIKPCIDEGKPCRVYILKARQMGFSTMTEALTYWRVSLWPYSTGLVSAHSSKQSAKIFQMLKIYYQHSDPLFRPCQKNNNRNELYFANSDSKGEPGIESQVSIDTADNKDLGAGSTLHVVHLSEFARYERINSDIQETMVTMKQAVPELPNTFVILETTAQGEGYSKDYWYKQDNGYTKFFIPWVADPTYTSERMVDPDSLSGSVESKYGNEKEEILLVVEALREWYDDEYDDEEAAYTEALKRLHWRRNKIDKGCEGNLDLFWQEYPTTPEQAFLSSGVRVFDPFRLKDMRSAIEYMPPKPTTWRYNPITQNMVEEKYGEYIEFERPMKGAVYCYGADAGHGIKDGDFSVISVHKYPEMRQVAVYRGRPLPDEFGRIINWVSLHFNTAFGATEFNGPGQVSTHVLWNECQNPAMYRRQSFDRIAKKYTSQLGFLTTTSSKPRIIDMLRGAIRMATVDVKYEEMIRELELYTMDKKGSYNAPDGEHDDTVMALALALEASKELPEQHSVKPKATSKWSAQGMLASAVAYEAETGAPDYGNVH